LTGAPPGGVPSPVYGVSFVTSQHTGTHDTRLLGLCVVVAALLIVASAAATEAAPVLAAFLRERRVLHRARNLTPEQIVGYKGSARGGDTPELISRRIVERSEQIRRALGTGPSEIEITMCAIGYSACADDLLALIQLVSELFPRCGPVCRLRMRTAVRRSADSLARTRRAFPPYARAGPSIGGTKKDVG
jgi:hypothetical protein